MTISDRGQSPESLGGAYVSAQAFRILGDRPILGRDFLAGDDSPGAPAVVVLGHHLWVSRYGADPGVIGRSVSVNGVPATVVGVMADGFEFPYRNGLWQPLALMKGLQTQRRDDPVLGVFGRLADGVNPAQARAELAAIAAALARDHRETNARIEPTAARFGEQQVGRFGDELPPLALVATAVFVLLIACANVANLLLARSAGRSREMAIRASVGATRWRIARQLLVESVLLALAAGALGLWLSTFGVRFISDAFGRNVPSQVVDGNRRQRAAVRGRRIQPIIQQSIKVCPLLRCWVLQVRQGQFHREDLRHIDHTIRAIEGKKAAHHQPRTVGRSRSTSVRP